MEADNHRIAVHHAERSLLARCDIYLVDIDDPSSQVDIRQRNITNDMYVTMINLVDKIPCSSQEALA